MNRQSLCLALLAAVLAIPATGGAQWKFPKHFSLGAATSAAAAIPPSNSVSQSVLTPLALWIGTSKGAASSADNGRHWTSYRSDPSFANDGIYALDAENAVVWAATGYDKEITDGTVQTGSGYAFTTDNGATWRHAGQALDAPADSFIVFGINDSMRILPVTVPEQNVTFDASIAPHGIWIASWASGLRRTTDFGTTWERKLLPSDAQSSIADTDTLWRYAPNDTAHLHRIFSKYDPRRSNNYLAFSVLALDDSVVWCGTAGGVNRTTNGGRSWRRFSHQNQAQAIPGNWVIAIGYQQYLSLNRLWVTNWKADDPTEEYGISFTDDGGETWHAFLAGVKAYGFAFNKNNGAVYIASDDGVYRTADGGATFSLASSITDPAGHQVVVRPSAFTVAVIGDTVIVGTSDGIARTVDNINSPFGQVWSIQRSYVPVSGSGDSYAYPNPFSPRFQVTRFHYAIPAGSAGAVTIDLYDYGMNRVRNLLHDAPRTAGTEYDEIWDGRRDDGTTVANGVYFYRITVDNNDPLFGKVLVLQ